MKTAIALGTFDGLHRAHRAVLKQTQGFYSVAVTFKIPPKAVLTGSPQLLILPDDRKRRLEMLGINQVIMQDFNAVKNISAIEYLDNLKKIYNPSRIVCGFNYRFGAGALGYTELLNSFCTKNNIELIVVPAVTENGEAISSTAIRKMIANGDIQRASNAIYGGFCFDGVVKHGDARGRKIGFPTANQDYPDLLVKAKSGVYLSRANVDGVLYDAITNVGVRPTYQTEKIGCETYIKGLNDDIYGKNIKIELLRFIRSEQKFNSLDELKNAISNDIKLLG